MAAVPANRRSDLGPGALFLAGSRLALSVLNELRCVAVRRMFGVSRAQSNLLTSSWPSPAMTRRSATTVAVALRRSPAAGPLRPAKRVSERTKTTQEGRKPRRGRGFAISAGGGTRTPDTRIMIPRDSGLAIGDFGAVGHAIGHKCLARSTVSACPSLLCWWLRGVQSTPSSMGIADLRQVGCRYANDRARVGGGATRKRFSTRGRRRRRSCGCGIGTLAGRGGRRRAGRRCRGSRRGPRRGRSSGDRGVRGRVGRG